MDPSRAAILLSLLCVFPPASAGSATVRGLSIEERVAAQAAIEEVYWRHRVWPEENPAPKPSLADVMSEHELRSKVEDYLRKSNALEQWGAAPTTTTMRFSARSSVSWDRVAGTTSRVMPGARRPRGPRTGRHRAWLD